MILEVYILLLCLSLVLLWFGYFTDDNIYSIIGISFFLVLGLILGGINIPWLEYTDNVTIKTGENSTISYTYSNSSITSQNIVLTNSYTSISDNTTKWIGRYMAILAIIGFALVMFNYRQRKEEEDND